MRWWESPADPTSTLADDQDRFGRRHPQLGQLQLDRLQDLSWNLLGQRLLERQRWLLRFRSVSGLILAEARSGLTRGRFSQHRRRQLGWNGPGQHLRRCQLWRRPHQRLHIAHPSFRPALPKPLHHAINLATEQLRQRWSSSIRHLLWTRTADHHGPFSAGLRNLGAGVLGGVEESVGSL